MRAFESSVQNAYADLNRALRLVFKQISRREVYVLAIQNRHYSMINPPSLHDGHKLNPGSMLRYREAQKVTWVSILVNIVLTIAQISIGLISHAHSLVADGFHSLADMVTDLLVLFGNAQGRHPADNSHPYGHQRIETAVSFMLGLILAVTGVGILWAAAQRLQHLDELPAVASLALWAALATLFAKEALFRYMLAVAQRLRSPMLVANAWHARSDAASSLVVAAGLLGSLAGYRFLDPVAAIIVGFLIVRMGAKFGYEALQELIDTAPTADEVNAIRTTLLATPGVLGLHELRTRRMAQRILADAHVQVDARISVSEGHRIAEAARSQVLDQHPEVLDVLVHVDPETDGADAVVLLPDRAQLLAHLQQSLLADDALSAARHYEKVLFHYLGRHVEAELYLDSRLASDAQQVQVLQQRIQNSLINDPYFSAIRLYAGLASIESKDMSSK